MNENCAECVFEDFNVSSGPNDTSGSACQMRQGRNNVVRNSILRFPAHTGNGLLLRSHDEAGNPNKDCGFENLQVFLPVCSSFLTVSDAGAGVVRPVFRNVKFFGAVSSRAGDDHRRGGRARERMVRGRRLAPSARVLELARGELLFPGGIRRTDPGTAQHQ
jgi:hypothetical protein